MAVNKQLVLAACGLAMLCWGLVAGTAPVNAHVQVRPASTIPATMPYVKRMATAAPQPRSAALAPLSALETEVVQVVQDPTFAGLSLAAVIVSASALAVSLLKLNQPSGASEPATAAPVKAPQPVFQASAETELDPSKMDAVALLTKAELEKARSLSPKEAILELQRGNARFWSGNPERPELNAMERRAQIIAQAPTVCILSCADSRVPVELVFDQGLGKVFVVRVAGNIVDSTAIGSIEFAVKYLGVKVLLVMGHEACGAVKGAVSMSPADLDAQPSYLKTVLLQIKENLNVEALQKIQDSRAGDREAVVQNVSSQVKKLQANPLIAERSANGSLLVAGAFYEITSGIVDFYTLDKNGLIVDI